jgi:hypothetical protein
MFKAKTVVARVLLGLLALAILDVALSLSLLRDGKLGKRPLPPFGVEFDPEQRAILERLATDEIGSERLTGFDRELGWCVRAGTQSPSGDYHINARGLRGTREYSPQPAADRLRLACFGDSFTFGDEVPDPFTYEALLERLAPSVEALNFGVPAYGTDQALLRLQREGIDAAQVVVLGLLLENIGRNVNRYRPLWAPRTLAPLAKPRFLLEGEQLKLLPQPFSSAQELGRAVRENSLLHALADHEYWSGRPTLSCGRVSSLARLAAGFFAYRERDPRRLWLDLEGEPRRLTLALVDQFQREAQARGARDFVVLLLPMRNEFEEFVADGKSYWSELPAELRARGIESLDIAPGLRAQQRLCDENPEHPTLYVSAHLSSVGNQVVAAELHAWLRRRGHLPLDAKSR